MNPPTFDSTVVVKVEIDDDGHTDGAKVLEVRGTRYRKVTRHTGVDSSKLLEKKQTSHVSPLNIRPWFHYSDYYSFILIHSICILHL